MNLFPENQRRCVRVSVGQLCSSWSLITQFFHFVFNRRVNVRSVNTKSCVFTLQGGEGTPVLCSVNTKSCVFMAHQCCVPQAWVWAAVRTTPRSNMHVKNSTSWFEFKFMPKFEFKPKARMSNACEIFSCLDLNLVCDIMFICDNVRLVFFSLECGSFIINSQYLRCHMLKYRWNIVNWNIANLHNLKLIPHYHRILPQLNTKIDCPSWWKNMLNTQKP